MDGQEIKEKVKQIFTEYLNSNGHRKTPERYAILEKIYSIDGQFGIDDLFHMMNDEKFRVSKATLYNTIVLLIDARLVIKHQFGISSQYEKSYNMHTHSHLICTECGKVSEIKDDVLKKTIEETKLPRFTMSHYTLYMYGICSKCMRKKKQKQKNK